MNCLASAEELDGHLVEMVNDGYDAYSERRDADLARDLAKLTATLSLIVLLERRAERALAYLEAMGNVDDGMVESIMGPQLLNDIAQGLPEA